MVKVKKSEVARASSAPLKEMMDHLFSTPLQMALEKEGGSELGDSQGWLYEQIKNIIVYIEEGHIRQSDYDRCLESLVTLFQEYSHRTDVVLKSFLEIVKQALLYYKIHHFSLTNVDAKYNRFYQSYDRVMDTLMPERTAV